MTEYEKTNPTSLVQQIAKPRLAMSSVISFVVHLILLGLLSISFIGQCIQYKTTHPKAAIQKLQKEKEEQEKQEKQQSAAKVAQQKALEISKQQEAAAKNKPAAKTDAKTANPDKRPLTKEEQEKAKQDAIREKTKNETLPANNATMDEGGLPLN